MDKNEKERIRKFKPILEEAKGRKKVRCIFRYSVTQRKYGGEYGKWNLKDQDTWRIGIIKKIYDDSFVIDEETLGEVCHSFKYLVHVQDE